MAEIARERDERLAQPEPGGDDGHLRRRRGPRDVDAARRDHRPRRAAAAARSPTTSARQECLQAILEQAERIKRVIRGFLELARGARAGAAARPAVRVVAGAHGAGRAPLRRGRRAAVRAACPGLPAIRCEPRLLEHALVNLLLNACDACRARRPGGDRGERRRRRRCASSSPTTATASRRGAARAAPSRSSPPSRRQGTGLGLAIASEIAKIHRGSLPARAGEPARHARLVCRSRSPQERPCADARPRILVVDDKLEMAETLADGLRDHGYEATRRGSSGERRSASLERRRVDALVTDLRMPDIDGLALLAGLARARARAPGDRDDRLRRHRLGRRVDPPGAYHYLTKPFKLDELVHLPRPRARRARACAARPPRSSDAARDAGRRAGIVGTSPAMRAGARRRRARRAHRRARAAHRRDRHRQGPGRARCSTRGARAPRGPFVTVNCAALPEALLESELFGHVKGAFTGATQDRAGLFAEAERRHALPRRDRRDAARRCRPSCCTSSRAASVRPVGATPRARASTCASSRRPTATCASASRAGAFREDLLYRLDVVPIELPPLRQRREDIAAARRALPRRRRAADIPARRSSGSRARRSPSSLDYRWPGNVRELAHVIERMVLLGRTRRGRRRAICRRSCVERRAAARHVVRRRRDAGARAAAPLRGLGAGAVRRPPRPHRRAAGHRSQDARQVARRDWRRGRRSLPQLISVNSPQPTRENCIPRRPRP